MEVYTPEEIKDLIREMVEEQDWQLDEIFSPENYFRLLQIIDLFDQVENNASKMAIIGTVIDHVAATIQMSSVALLATVSQLVTEVNEVHGRIYPDDVMEKVINQADEKDEDMFFSTREELYYIIDFIVRAKEKMPEMKQITVKGHDIFEAMWRARRELIKKYPNTEYYIHGAGLAGIQDEPGRENHISDDPIGLYEVDLEEIFKDNE